MWQALLGSTIQKIALQVVQAELDKKLGTNTATSPLQDPAVLAGKQVVLGYANNLIDQIETAAKTSPDKVVAICEQAKIGLKAVLG